MINRDNLINIIINSFNEVFSSLDNVVFEKGSHNFVSLVDIKLEAKLKQKLLEFDSSYGFICEESEATIKENNWIIDPIDGTTNYLSGLPFTTSVAEMRSGIVIRGLVIDYNEHAIYYAEKDRGAFLIDMHTRKSELLKCYSDKATLIGAFGIPYDRNKVNRILNIVSKNIDKFDDVKRVGPASLDICKVACNKYDCYFELDLKQWDIAAAKLVLTEAGGKFVRQKDLFVFFNDSFPLDL